MIFCTAVKIGECFGTIPETANLLCPISCLSTCLCFVTHKAPLRFQRHHSLYMLGFTVHLGWTKHLLFHFSTFCELESIYKRLVISHKLAYDSSYIMPNCQACLPMFLTTMEMSPCHSGGALNLHWIDLAVCWYEGNPLQAFFPSIYFTSLYVDACDVCILFQEQQLCVLKNTITALKLQLSFLFWRPLPTAVILSFSFNSWHVQTYHHPRTCERSIS